jgi:hypothetical protein
MSTPEERGEHGGDAALEADTPKPRFRLTVAVGLAVFTSVAMAGIGALNRVASGAGVEGASKLVNGGGTQPSSASDQYGTAEFTAMCHTTPAGTVTLSVGQPLVPAHLARGDTLGAC